MSRKVRALGEVTKNTMRMLTTITVMLASVLALTVPSVAQMAQDLTAVPENASTDQYQQTLNPPRHLLVEQLLSDTYSDLYPESSRVLLAPSAPALSSAIGAEVPDAGKGTYLAAYWGSQSTGGYSVAVESAGSKGIR
jgi:hypothetical protein